MELKEIFEKIDFVNRYQNICKNYNDFENRMRDSTKQLQKEILDTFNYKYKYISNGSFYQIKEEFDNLLFNLHLVLKGGQVESLIYIYKNRQTLEPNGRLDFLPEDLGITYDRLKYGALPKYSSEKELKEILKDLFLIYEDIKTEFIERNQN